MPASRAAENRKIRREALREQLAAKGLIQKVLETLEKLDELDPEMDNLKLQAIKVGIDTRLALIKKYLPDVKQVELTGEDGDPMLFAQVERRIVDPAD